MSADRSCLETRPSLLVRIRDACDADAWRTFVTIYAPVVYRYARRRGLQDADAADVTQEVLSEVAGGIRSFEYRPERGRFRDWLFTVTRRVVWRFHARAGRQGERACDALDARRSSVLEHDIDWNEGFNARVFQAALERARPHFEPVTWRAFERVWIDDQSAAETAAELSIPIQIVYVAKSRVLKRLQEEVEALSDAFSWLDGF